MIKKKKTKQIKKTAEPMPSLIFQNVQLEEKKSPEPTKPFYQPQPVRRDKGARTLLWFGVLAFSLVIVFLWGWALKIKLDNFNWRETPENKMISTAKSNWDEYFNEQKTKQQMEENKKKIEGMVGTLFRRADETASSTITTTTP